jgi:hypothetical protein
MGVLAGLLKQFLPILRQKISDKRLKESSSDISKTTLKTVQAACHWRNPVILSELDSHKALIVKK